MIKPGQGVSTKDKRAKAILESAVLSDDAICKKYRISKRTWQRWLAEFKNGNDADLTQAVAEKKRAVDAAWADKIPKALDACLQYIIEAAAKAPRDNPDVIHAMAGALKMVVETDGTNRLIDARIHGQNGGAGKATGPVPAGPNVVPIRSTG